jgi:glycosyltransferase involved in cell wall biosynthesis
MSGEAVRRNAARDRVNTISVGVLPTQILFVHHRPEPGGAPTSLARLIQSLDPDEFEVHVYSPPGPAAELFARAGAVVHTGTIASFTHVWTSVYRGRRWLLFLLELTRLPAHLLSLGRVLDAHSFALVHLNDSPLVAAAWLARRRGVPVVWHLRSSLPHAGRDIRSRLIRRFIRRTAAVSIAINEDVADVFDVDAKVIPNAVDLQRFTPGGREEAREALELGQEELVAAFVGFIYPLKGFREFFDAARETTDRGIEATYLVVGGAVRGEDFFRTFRGRALERLGLAQDFDREARERVASLGLEDRVRFVRFTPDTARVYKAADVLVAPSQGPELGRPVIEAAASGIPVIASGSKSGAGIATPGETALLVPEGDPARLAEALVTLLGDPERRSRMGAAARRSAEATFDERRNAAQIVALYRDVIEPSERTRVLFVHHRPQLGGAPASLVELIRNLDERFEPHVYTPAGAAAEMFRAAGAAVHIGPVSIFAHTWDSPYKGLRWLIPLREALLLVPHGRAFRAVLRRHRFEIVHLNDSPLLPAARIAHKADRLTIWHLRSALAGEGRDGRSRTILSLMDRWGDAAICIDEDVADRFALTIPTTIVHNSTPSPERQPDSTAAKKALGLPSEGVTVGFAGYLRRQKGWPELVDAAAMLARRDVNVHFVIIGGGIRPPTFFKTARGRLLELTGILTDDESAIHRRVAERGLSSHFTFVPFTPDRAEIYGALDIVAFPNQGVGLGRPVLEAAAFGRPVVASGSRRGGGILVDESTGILLHDATPESIAEALERLVADNGLRERMGAAAAEHARRNFDPRRNAEAVELIYDRLLGRGAPPLGAGERMQAAG